MPKLLAFPALSASTYPAQQACFILEQKSRDIAEKHLLEQVREFVATNTHQLDIRDLAPAVRELLGAGYCVGSGSSHVWVKRSPAPEGLEAPPRLAMIADRLTTPGLGAF